jgi:hypothetical protein
MKPVFATLAILFGTLTCALAGGGMARLMHWLQARPELMAATQPWLFLTTLVLVGAAAIQMARRRAD